MKRQHQGRRNRHESKLEPATTRKLATQTPVLPCRAISARSEPTPTCQAPALPRVAVVDRGALLLVAGLLAGICAVVASVVAGSPLVRLGANASVLVLGGGALLRLALLRWRLLPTASVGAVALALLAVPLACGGGSGGGGAPPILDGTVHTLSDADELLFDDQIGSLTEVTTGTGKTKGSFAAYPFGLTRYDTTAETLKYAGTPRDVAVGVDQMGARAYVPELGVFASADPLRISKPERGASGGFAGDHAYAYTALSPIALRDPSGLDPIAEFFSSMSAVFGSETHGTEAPPGAELFGDPGMLKAEQRALGTDPVASAIEGAKFAAIEPVLLGANALLACIGQPPMEVSPPPEHQNGSFAIGYMAMTFYTMVLPGEGEVDGAELAARVAPSLSRGERSALRAVRAELEGAAVRGGETAATKAGRAAHQNYGTALGAEYSTEVTLPSGKRADAVHNTLPEVRELKPDNARAIKKGQRQVDGYARELESTDPQGRSWTGVVDTYKSR